MGPQLNIDLEEKSYGDLVTIFSGFRLAIAPSSVVALVGPSGVGKSTLLRLIAGIDTDYRGRIEIDGIDAREAPPAGFVFQDPRLLPWRTAIQNLLLARPDASPEKAAALLASVGLAGSENAYPHELSGGMQRRVALARAVLVNPALWLYDEPFVSLDRHLVDELQRLFLNMIDTEAPTVVFVTHVVEDAARLATRAVVLSGRPVGIAADIALDDHPARRDAETVQRYSQMIVAGDNRS